MTSSLQDNFTAILETLKKQTALVQVMGGSSSFAACAQVIQMLGGQAVLADTREETAEIAEQAQALLLLPENVDERLANRMMTAAQAFKDREAETFLSLQGLERSAYRCRLAQNLLSQGLVTAARGTYDEVAALMGSAALPVGTGTKERAALALQLAGKAAHQYGCIFCLTTPDTVYISGGHQEVLLQTGAEMLELLPEVPAQGAALGALLLTATADKFAAAALSQVLLGEGSVLAKHFTEKKDGPGTFAVRLTDGIYNIVANWKVFQMQLQKLH